MAYPTYPIPAVAAVIREHGRLLLVKRKVEPSKGQWSLPGGRIELGEDLKAALRREIHEELQIDVSVKDLVAVKDYVERDDAGRIKWHYILLDYECERLSGTPQPRSDAEEKQWVPFTELSEINLTETTRELIQEDLRLRDEMEQK